MYDAPQFAGIMSNAGRLWIFAPVIVVSVMSVIVNCGVTAVIEHYSVNVNVKVESVKGVIDGHVSVYNASIL